MPSKAGLLQDLAMRYGADKNLLFLFSVPSCLSCNRLLDDLAESDLEGELGFKLIKFDLGLRPDLIDSLGLKLVPSLVYVSALGEASEVVNLDNPEDVSRWIKSDLCG